MLQLTVFMLMTIGLCVNLILAFKLKYLKKLKDFSGIKSRNERLGQENEKLKAYNSELGRVCEDMIALYDITKDLCNSLDEEKVFNLFKANIGKYLEVKDCLFLKPGANLEELSGYALLPLAIRNDTIGYLAVSGVGEPDKDKFHILSQQFLLGMKRALLYKQVQELTITDALTHSFSRRHFLERFGEELVRSKKFSLKFSFLLVDTDHFKEYNDRYGHLVGDAVLGEVGKTIKENIRQIDFMGRYGGDELAVVLTETDKENALPVAERIRKAIENKKIRVYDEELNVTVSIGISAFPPDAKDTDTLIDRADIALYKAKQEGRNRICNY
ncbi:MAG: GGDEF domain-containing protein [Candidatus Omnitrophota bacterium]